MSKVLFIAGHGSGSSGATGFIKKGEHRYVKENLYPAMRKLVHPNDKKNMILFNSYNVFSRGNLVSLAKQYGKDTKVNEVHYDASTNRNARGGHVIIHKYYKPDEIDLDLIKGLKNTIGINGAYNHRNVKGLSGRNDLANVNRAYNGKVNYRLIELGFGTNKTDSDYMIKHVDELAKVLLIANFGRIKNNNKNDDKLYKVQTGAFKNLKNAKRLKDKLNKDGYDTFITND